MKFPYEVGHELNCSHLYTTGVSIPATALAIIACCPGSSAVLDFVLNEEAIFLLTVMVGCTTRVTSIVVFRSVNSVVTHE